METYRAVGLEEEIEEAAAREFVQNGAIVSVDSLGGTELDWYFRFINEGVEHLSPSARVFVTQIGLEPVLLRAAERLGVEIRYASEAVSVEQDDSGVTVVVQPRDGGPERHRAGSLPHRGGRCPQSDPRAPRASGSSATGASRTASRSTSRRMCAALMGDRNLSVVYVFGPRLQGFFRFSIDLQAGFLVVNSTVDEDGTRSVRIGEDMTTPSCIRYVREALGDPEIPVEIENVQRWSASAEYAERLRAGRIFLAGDSAHVMPPTGGFGGNCGVQDGYDLAWKLAYVLDGRADETLLATYDAERQPVGAFTTEQAYTRYVLRLDPSLGKEDLMPIVGEAPIELGYRHLSSGRRSRTPTTTGAVGGPGRAVWSPGLSRPARADHGRRRRTIDAWICSGATLSCSRGSGGESWSATRHVRRVASLGVSVDVYGIGTDLGDPSGMLEDRVRHRPGGRRTRPAGRVRRLAGDGGTCRSRGRALGRARRGAGPAHRRTRARLILSRTRPSVPRITAGLAPQVIR